MIATVMERVSHDVATLTLSAGGEGGVRAYNISDFSLPIWETVCGHVGIATGGKMPLSLARWKRAAT